jgi:uncharacterized membrane protein
VAPAADLYEWLLLLHILGAIVWLGGLVVLNVLATLAVRGGEPATVARFVANLRVVGPLTLAPSMAAVIGFGIWLVLDSGAWEFGQAWIWVALILFGAAFLVGAGFQGRAAIAAQRAAESGDHREAARQLVRWSWGMRLILVLLVVVVWDMVFKPGI